jgi:Fe-S-cluster-containing dehydrogenase component/formate-dependent nitrite reductase membrane component NrfD
MNYGFVIDNRACIGCHACSTACKSENDVPLGVYRTWVKYVETGAGADARRHFQVTRCNHCANPPCVRICPVTAMYQRHDGIVEFDARVCIGCKACLQACPYDAIYIDPDNGTAAKCHYCSHRTELGLEPACVVVCPTHAILAGDLDDPASEIARAVAREKVTVRRPEQGTAPKLYYIEGTHASLHPTASDQAPETFMFADVVAGGRDDGDASFLTMRPARPASALSGARLRAIQPQGLPAGGALTFGGRLAGQMVQVSYNAQHRTPWHWPVAAYLVTKALGAGLFGLMAFGLLTGLLPFHAPSALAAGTSSLLLIGLTTALLVYDLERPERFLRVLLRPQWQSWLARGAFLLVGFSVLLGVWILAEAGAYWGWLPLAFAAAARPVLLALGLPLALGAAVYTAFLLGQAEGRDLWQSPLLPVHMAVQAVMMGAAALSLLAAALPAAPGLVALARVALLVSIAVDLVVIGLGDLSMPHATEAAARAADAIRRGPWARTFWGGAVLIGHLLPLSILTLDGALATAVAGGLAVAGLACFEHAFVMAPQEVPNS